MTDVDMIYEAAVADDWEEQNRPESEGFPNWKDATAKMTLAKASLVAAAALISEASEMVEGSTQEDRIASLSAETDSIAASVANLIERMKLL